MTAILDVAFRPPVRTADAKQPDRTRERSRKPLPDLFLRCREIRDRYADGVPLSAEDRKVVLSALRQHPKGREKFGAGVQAVIAHTYVGGTRCFFVVRADGTAEDFSLRKCFREVHAGRRKTPAIREQMATFDYGGVVRRFRAWLKMGRSR